MSFEINDYTLIDEIQRLNSFMNANVSKFVEPECLRQGFQHPLDNEIMDLLKEIKPNQGEAITYEQGERLENIWVSLIEKSIKCLRYFDSREPFLENSKKTPLAYNIDSVKRYHEKYVEFERLLYGGANFYRDHVFHAIRTWLLGVFCLLKSELCIYNKCLYTTMEIDGESENLLVPGTNPLEIVSMWTLIALCHDLGYPLEKTQTILQKTNNMMREFITNPSIWNNYSFSGGQANINEYIVKFMSTKIKQKDSNGGVGRIQPKYYIKFSKSLESFSHGIVSAIIIYTMLLYFLESDFNLNDDYTFDDECTRQFYIRREILRAISSHTCSDIYSIKISTFTSLLFLCDELQEWGRKTWDQLYTGDMSNKIKLSIENFCYNEIRAYEEIDMRASKDDAVYDYLKRIIEKQYFKYRLVFRDGQYSNSRQFNLRKKIKFIMKNDGATQRHIQLEFGVLSTDADYFNIYASNASLIDTLNSELSNSINKNEIQISHDLLH